jgi:hypothetical protein
MSQPPLDKLHFCEHSNVSNNICNSQWVTLYTTAAYLPEKFEVADKELVTAFYTNFSDQCRDEKIGGSLNRAEQTLNLNSRRELMLSLCTLENDLRQQAGLPLRQCRYNKLMERWRYSDGYL